MFWSGPDGRDRFYRYYTNEPFQKTHAQLEALTDREVYEHFYRHYEPADAAADAVAEIDRIQAEAQAAWQAKPLDQRKKEYWDLCRSQGCKDADIQKQWDAYLRGET